MNEYTTAINKSGQMFNSSSSYLVHSPSPHYFAFASSLNGGCVIEVGAVAMLA